MRMPAPARQPPPPKWGLHHLDTNIALDDLVALVAAQAKTYTG
jgi:hypothetical protein